jgi:hypothetical protein
MINLFTHVILEFCLFISIQKVLGSDTTTELLKKTSLKKVSDANDFDCVDSRSRNHMSPDLRYFVNLFILAQHN